jgi:hypothetical protein
VSITVHKRPGQFDNKPFLEQIIINSLNHYMSIIKNTKTLAIVATAVVIAVGAVTINSIGLTSA